MSSFVYTHKTHDGKKARLIGGSILTPGGISVLFAVKDSDCLESIAYGRAINDQDGCYKNVDSGRVIQPVNPWENVAIDTPVLVRVSSGTIRRYFAGLNTNGKLVTFNDGANEWSAGEYPRTSEWFMDQVTLADGTQPTI